MKAQLSEFAASQQNECLKVRTMVWAQPSLGHPGIELKINIHLTHASKHEPMGKRELVDNSSWIVGFRVFNFFNIFKIVKLHSIACKVVYISKFLRSYFSQLIRADFSPLPTDVIGWEKYSA